jgi:hypothetical protein
MGIIDLWLPILVSTAVCWAASFVIWVALKYHNSDYKKLNDEDAASSGLRGHAPGFYLLPHCLDPADMNDPNVKKKFEDGPIAYITMLPNGMPAMGSKMISMILYFLAVGVVCAYFVSRTLAPDADYLAVFRIAGTVAFVANGFAVIPESIWFGRPWSMTIKNAVDALIYALLTGGVFGWLV